MSEELLVETKEPFPLVRHYGDQLLLNLWQPDELTLSNDVKSTPEEEELNEVDDMHLVSTSLSSYSLLV